MNEMPPRLEALQAWLAPGGRVAEALPGFEPREGQQEMLAAVAAALEEGDRLLVEAGTGTGKSLAYLIPAVAWAVRQGERVVLSTQTLTLQAQLWQKELPFLAGVLPFPFRAALLMGWRNYLCLLRWEEVRGQHSLFQGEGERRLFDRIDAQLAAEEAGEGTAAAFGVQGAEEESAWRKVSLEREACLGSACRWFRSCFAYRARWRAEEADLLVVNHALLCADARAGHHLLPPYRRLICDEAHHLAETAAAQFGDLFHPLLFRRLAEGALAAGPPAVQKAAERLLQVNRRFWRLLAAWWEEEGQKGEGRLHPDHCSGPAWSAAREAWQRLAGALEALGAALGAGAETAAPSAEEAERLALQASLAREQAERLGWTLEAAEQTVDALDPPWVAWLEAEGEAWGPPAGGEEPAGAPGNREEPLPQGKRLVLRGTPVEAGKLLRERLWEPLATVVFTSGTLRVAGRFEYALSQLGLEASGCLTLSVDSPFDYREQALLALVEDLADPREALFEEEVAEFLALLQRAVGRRTLALFTAHRMLRRCYERLRQKPASGRGPVLAQGLDGSGAALLERFRSAPNGLLLGTAALWEGVDLPGEALECVVLVRLPFQPPGRPREAARAELIRSRGGSPFRDEALPAAILRFRQGFGRLIRTRGDRGAVIVLDPRLSRPASSYRLPFLLSLPEARRCHGNRQAVLEAVRDWFGALPPSRAPRILEQE